MKLACPQAHFPHQISIAAVAQWIEYWPPKPRVVGSIPASRTIYLCHIVAIGQQVMGKLLNCEKLHPLTAALVAIACCFEST
jgi:hypothetical protein